MLMWMFKILRGFFCLPFSCGQSPTPCSTCHRLKVAEEPRTEWHSSVFDCFEPTRVRIGALTLFFALYASAAESVWFFQAAVGSGVAPASHARFPRDAERTPACHYATSAATAAFEIPLFIHLWNKREKPAVISIVNVQPAPIVQHHPGITMPPYPIQAVATPRWALIGQARPVTPLLVLFHPKRLWLFTNSNLT